MRSLANIFNLGIKEFRSLGRDYAMLALIVWAFTLGVYSSATGIPETLHHAPIAVVDEDRSQLSSRIVNAFQPPYFRPPEMIGHAEMDRGMDVGLYTFTLDIPPDFQRDVLAGRKPSIQVNVDATQTGQAFSGAGYIQNIVATEVREFVSRYRAEPSMPAQIEVRMEFNPNLTQAWFGGVMEVINQITMLSIILTGAALIREREHGTVEHLLLGGTVPARRRIASVRHHLHGHIPRHGGAFDAAARTVDHPRAAAAEHSFGRHHATGKHAGTGAEHHAGGADHAFRQPGPGDPVPRRRFRHRLAAVRRYRGDRFGVLLRRALAFPPDHLADGLSDGFSVSPAAGSPAIPRR